MDFPSTTDFLATFGIEPAEVDPGLAYCRYVRRSADGELELDFSYSMVARSFQVMLKHRGNELAIISSERVRRVQIRQEHGTAGILVEFDVPGGTAEAFVRLEPDLHCRWWTLRN
jgi:hypothetical protein